MVGCLSTYNLAWSRRFVESERRIFPGQGSICCLLALLKEIRTHKANPGNSSGISPCDGCGNNTGSRSYADGVGQVHRSVGSQIICSRTTQSS